MLLNYLLNVVRTCFCVWKKLDSHLILQYETFLPRFQIYKYFINIGLCFQQNGENAEWKSFEPKPNCYDFVFEAVVNVMLLLCFRCQRWRSLGSWLSAVWGNTWGMWWRLWWLWPTEQISSEPELNSDQPHLSHLYTTVFFLNKWPEIRDDSLSIGLKEF